MKTPRFFLAVLAGIVALSAVADRTAARTLRADYSVSLRGFPVGRAELRAEIADRRYTIAFAGRISGLARLLAEVSAEAWASGEIATDRPRAESYAHVWTEDDDIETVSMQFAGDGVTEIDLNPPLRRPERYVPMSAEDKSDAVDLVSAFLWPTATGVSPEACERTLPLIDGHRRFDIHSVFARMDSFALRNGSRHRRAVVCGLSYRPIAGHRIDKEKDGFLSDGGEMEVWLVAAGDGLVAPVKVQFDSRFGRVVLQATHFETQ